jgi:hypothetical protein
LTFLATTEDTHGELIKIENEVPAGTPGVPMHYHLSFTESFYVLESRLDVYVGRHNHVELSAGQSAPARAGVQARRSRRGLPAERARARIPAALGGACRLRRPARDIPDAGS